MRRYLSSVSAAVLDALYSLVANSKKVKIQDAVFDDWMNRGQGLIYVIFPEADLAELILFHAVNGYSTSGNRWGQRGGTKVSLTDVQGLQAYIFEYLEKCEQYQEQLGLPDEPNALFGEGILSGHQLSPRLQKALHLFHQHRQGVNWHDWVGRYLKKLVGLTSQYQKLDWVLQGIPRLAYFYSNSEIMSLAEEFMPQQERYQRELNPSPQAKDEDNLRKAYSHTRKTIMEGLQKRFALEVVTGKSGERFFVGQVNSHESTVPTLTEEITTYVSRCLEIFSPWGFDLSPLTDLRAKEETLVGERIGQWAEQYQQPALAFNFAVLHPESFEQLTSEILDAPPKTRLALPHFFSNSGNSSRGLSMPTEPNWRWRFLPAPPNVTSLRTRLDHERLRRQHFQGDQVWVGTGRHRIELKQSSLARLVITREDCLIEVTGIDAEGELLLTTLLADLPEFEVDWWFRTFGSTVRKVQLEGGQTITFRIYNHPEDTEKLEIEVIYHQSRVVPFLVGGADERRFSNLAWATSFLILVGVLLGVFLYLRPQPQPPIGKKSDPPPAPAPPPSPVEVPSLPKPEPEQKAYQPPPRLNPPSHPQMMLPKGDSELEQQYWQAVREELAQAGDWKVTSRPTGAAFKLERETTLSGADTTFLIQLFDQSGNLTWSKVETISETNLREKAKQTAAQLGKIKTGRTKKEKT